MNRRGFLGTLLASLGTLAIDPQALLWTPPAASEGLPVLGAGALVDLKGITKAVAEEVARGWQVAASKLVDQMRGSRLGEGRMNHQFHAAIWDAPSSLSSVGLDHERYIRPVGAALAHRLRESRATVCGPMILPGMGTGIEQAVTVRDDSGVWVRGTLMFGSHVFDLDPVSFGRYLRFDVLARS